jgi:hypothetical protein
MPKIYLSLRPEQEKLDKGFGQVVGTRHCVMVTFIDRIGEYVGLIRKDDFDNSAVFTDDVSIMAGESSPVIV